MDRLSIVLLIPELSLVVVGSQNGRVVLITPTRLEDSFSNKGPATFFRVEAILPSKAMYHQEVHSPLLGVAISPLQQYDDVEPDRNGSWRIILHYYDQKVMSYEVSRSGHDGLKII